MVALYNRRVFEMRGRRRIHNIICVQPDVLQQVYIDISTLKTSHLARTYAAVPL